VTTEHKDTDGLDPRLVVLGRVLRDLRRQRRLIRKAVVRKLNRRGVDISIPALATYELGTRVMGVTRLWQLAEVYGTTPAAIMDQVDRHESATWQTTHVTIDLETAATLTDPALAPVREWARSTTRAMPFVPGTKRRIQVKWTALEPLATADLITRLPTPRLADALDIDERRGPDDQSEPQTRTVQ
jgi:transcriptional regulator with XRE-family HTH domain